MESKVSLNKFDLKIILESVSPGTVSEDSAAELSRGRSGLEQVVTCEQHLRTRTAHVYDAEVERAGLRMSSGGEYPASPVQTAPGPGEEALSCCFGLLCLGASSLTSELGAFLLPSSNFLGKEVFSLKPLK